MIATAKILKFLDDVDLAKSKHGRNGKSVKVYINKKQRFFYFLFIPIFQLIEFYLYRKYWKIILDELNKHPDIIDWFDKQEFGIAGHKLWKIDLIEEDTFLETLDFIELNVKIKGEFVKKIIDLFQENNLMLDIENYISLQVFSEYAEGTRRKQYTVLIQYYRYDNIVRNRKWFLLWHFIAFILTGIFIYFRIA